MNNWYKYGSLVGVNIIYACVTLCSKFASQYEFLSIPYYFVGLLGAIVLLGVYALLWQQILQRVPVSDAYMFKGTSLVFVMLFSYWIFAEPISWNNIVGTVIIIIGIALFANADRKEIEV